MKITLEQLEVLERLKCQRLSSDSQNMYEVENFSNDINDDIAQTLRNEAFSNRDYRVVDHRVSGVWGVPSVIFSYFLASRW